MIESGFPTPTGDHRVGTIPLYRPEQLLILGDLIVVPGMAPSGGGGDSGDGEGQQGGEGRSHTWGGTGTDLEELDTVGMSVALSFERLRLRRLGHADASIFVPGEPSDRAFVFDVSNPARIKAAALESLRFRQAIERLGSHVLSIKFPGFDILTLDPVDPLSDRLIELKSSGVDAQVQSMTWNEWKTARDSVLREQFFLYLVSNLRSDLGDRKPYLRAIKDPFGSLLHQELIESGVRRSIQLRVQEFAEAEHQPLEVVAGGAEEINVAQDSVAGAQ